MSFCIYLGSMTLAGSWSDIHPNQNNEKIYSKERKYLIDGFTYRNSSINALIVNTSRHPCPIYGRNSHGHEIETYWDQVLAGPGGGDSD